MKIIDMLRGPAKYCMNCGDRLARRKSHGRTRAVCGGCGSIYFKNPASASAAVVLRDGGVVLVRRKLPPNPGSWCLPAGFQEYDESPEETAVRETKEETNLDIRILGLGKVFFSTAFPGKNTVVHVYRAECAGGVLRPGDDASEVAVFPINRLPRDFAFASHHELIMELVRRFQGPGATAGGGRPRAAEKSGALNVAVVMGGRTAEHDISLATGKMIVDRLDGRKYAVKPVVISRDGQWRVPRGYPGAGRRSSTARESPLSVGDAINRLLDDRVDIVFIAMHGPYGEDGTIQGMLEMADIPYTGSGVCASALAMDKVKAKQIYACHGIPTPACVVLDAPSWKRRRKSLLSRVRKETDYPCVLKPARLGSSVGAAICADASALAKSIGESFAYDSRLLVERFIDGREFTCAVLDTPGGKPPVALPPTEIIPRASGYFDYHAKYTPGATSEITPAPVGKRLTSRIQSLAVRAHDALGCRAMSRSDMILGDGGLYVLETNTIPGMTLTSLLPQAAKAHGLSFPRLLDLIITVSLEAHREERRE